MSGLLRNKYKIAGPQTWELVRAAYLAGDSARVVAERYGVTIAAIRRRANKEKWTKRHLAEALEARGIAPPPPPAAPDYIEPHIPRAVERLAEDAAREAEMNALVEQIASDEDAEGIAAAIERRALAQASAAMVRGRTKEAQALASMAEMMRRRVVAAAAVKAPERAALETLTPAELERRALAQAGQALSRGEAAGAKALTAVAEQMRRRVEDERQRDAALQAQTASQVAEVRRCRELELAEKFRYAAFLAYCMVHNPRGAPAIFVDLVAGIRREAFGEGDEESLAAARRSAQDSRRYFGLDEDTWDAAFEAMIPTVVDDGGRDPSPAWAGERSPKPPSSPEAASDLRA